jgi:hypothetical protein
MSYTVIGEGKGSSGAVNPVNVNPQQNYSMQNLQSEITRKIQQIKMEFDQAYQRLFVLSFSPFY